MFSPSWKWLTSAVFLSRQTDRSALISYFPKTGWPPCFPASPWLLNSYWFPTFPNELTFIVSPPPTQKGISHNCFPTFHFQAGWPPLFSYLRIYIFFQPPQTLPASLSYLPKPVDLHFLHDILLLFPAKPPGNKLDLQRVRFDVVAISVAAAVVVEHVHVKVQLALDVSQVTDLQQVLADGTENRHTHSALSDSNILFN